MIVIVGVALVLGESLDFMKLLGCGIGKCSGPICLYIIIIFVVFPLFFDHFSNVLSSLLCCVLLVCLSGIGGVFLYSIIDNIVKPKEE